MLKTNSKKARENVRAYIVGHADGTNYGIDLPATFEGVAQRIHKHQTGQRPGWVGVRRRMRLSRAMSTNTEDARKGVMWPPTFQAVAGATMERGKKNESQRA